MTFTPLKAPDLPVSHFELALRLHTALTRLRLSYDYARDLDLDLWDFAVEIQELRAEGVSNNDLRWLVCKGFVLHADEITSLGDNRRTFQTIGRLNFCKRTCFVLTEEGAKLVLELRGRESNEHIPLLSANGCAHGDKENGPGGNGHRLVAFADADAETPLPQVPVLTPKNASPPSRPCWDRDRQELRVGTLIVKQFKVPAPNQETILAAFQEEGWPHRIDDPIPPHPDKEPKRRLHDTIISLNRNQRTPLIRFLGDGSGQGVRWEPTDHALWGAVGTNDHQGACAAPVH